MNDLERNLSFMVLLLWTCFICYWSLLVIGKLVLLRICLMYVRSLFFSKPLTLIFSSSF